MNQDNPVVSAVVVNWNQKLLTERCLKSLQGQTEKNLEIILVDNNSQDGSVEYLKQRFSEIKIIALGENIGFAGGCNRGYEVARGKYLALLNNDAEATTTWLESLLSTIKLDPRVGFCASKMILFDHPDRLDCAGDYLSPAGTGGKIGHGEASTEDRYDQPRTVFGACAGAALYKREMLEEIGLFDEDFFVGQEDVDLSFRAQLCGYKCLYVPTAVVHHHLNATLKTNSDTYVYYGHRNLEYVYFINMPLFLLILTFPLHLLDVLLSFCFFALSGRSRAFLRAKRDVFRNWDELMHKRKSTQQLRKVPVSRIFWLFDWKWLIYKLKRVWR